MSLETRYQLTHGNLLGLGYETEILPKSINMGQNPHPLGKRGWVMGSNHPNPITHG
jgi:hypothetical protein